MQAQGQSQAATRFLRIFISSTAVDLGNFREKVRDAVLGLKSLPIAMETFSAQPGQPASECMRMAAESDAVICIVAHRYGHIPTPEMGGDGERSMTWLEVEAAKSAKKPIFAFLVDPKAPWAEVKESDRLNSELPEKDAEIVKAVHKLKEFRDYLKRECIVATFSNADQLCTRVAVAIANFVPHSDQFIDSAERGWRPYFSTALQPALHFRGRESELQRLMDWLKAPVTSDKVLSVIATGGAGKTALVNEAVGKFEAEADLSSRAGFFVWSFYEDPNTDAFLRSAYMYFTGDTEVPVGGILERLQQALTDDLSHVLVLDGLELVQSEGNRPENSGVKSKTHN